ncbi:MAG TPA: thioredoxin domain-containing protein [Anaeromyxobacteraceae bacterium]|jgi:protein-disulfide isomerase|nr:thioredoxin domain-containing protein [Anaeromyxobacteraceae bacterium]
MKKIAIPALALAGALALLAATGGSARAAATPDLSQLLPNLPLERLSAQQREELSQVLSGQYCHCGCPHTLTGCLREHKSCHHAPRMAALAARLAAGGLRAPEISKLLTEYYGSFERSKRARLDVKDFGPPQGKASAPVTVVEFSDFTCPYCQLLRPQLEDFVDQRRERVRLFYKPFPLPAHARSAEAAETGEWAREKGFFWPMHDTLFTHPHDLADHDLATYAKQLGGDPADLAKALATRRYKAKVEGSKAEATAAGLTGTPTLFFNGRRYTLPDYSPAAIEFTLEDEEEWHKHGGWQHD